MSMKAAARRSFGKMPCTYASRMYTSGSSPKSVSCPSPWCASRSTIMTRVRPRAARSDQIAWLMSLYTQKPWPLSRLAWWNPPPRFTP